MLRRAKSFRLGQEIAYKIKERVKKELGITLSVGVSFNKTFAKLGSDMKKPDAITVIRKTNLRRKSGICLPAICCGSAEAHTKR